MGFSLRYVKYRPLTNMLSKTCSIFYESEFLDSKGRVTLKFMINSFVWKRVTSSNPRVASSYPRITSSNPRVQIRELED